MAHDVTEPNYLLEAIHKLTLPHRSKVIQSRVAGYTDANGKVLDTLSIDCISEVEHEPLLVALRDAVVGGIGSHGGTAGATSARIPFNSDALDLFDEISSQVNRWYLALDEPLEHLHIHTRLGRWYLAFERSRQAGGIDPERVKWAERLVRGWARRIEALFDPPTVLELNAPCPECGERFALDPRTTDQRTAVVIEYHNLGLETLDAAVAYCRFCGEVWEGRTALRALAWYVEHPGESSAAVVWTTTTGEQEQGS